MIAIEDQRHPQERLHYIGVGEVFEYQDKIYVKVDETSQYNFTDNSICCLGNDTLVRAIHDAVLCLG